MKTDIFVEKNKLLLNLTLPAHVLAAEADEKKMIRNYFQNKLNGFFIEVGSNDPTSPESQSFHLETLLGWHGLLIEPIPELAALAVKFRPLSIVCQNACTAPGKPGEVELLLPLSGDNLIAGHASLEANADEHNYKQFKKIAVTALTLSDLCQEHKINSVDFLSIDVEGSELDVLLGSDLDRLQPQLILLEDKHLYLSKHRFLKSNGYVLVQRHNRNCWYIRRGFPMPKVSLASRIRLLKRMYISICFKKIAYAIKHKSLNPFRTF